MELSALTVCLKGGGGGREMSHFLPEASLKQGEDVIMSPVSGFKSV